MCLSRYNSLCIQVCIYPDTTLCIQVCIYPDTTLCIQVRINPDTTLCIQVCINPDTTLCILKYAFIDTQSNRTLYSLPSNGIFLTVIKQWFILNYTIFEYPGTDKD